MGDKKRFFVFAKFLSIHFPVKHYSKIIDVAGGQGSLQMELSRYGYDVITIDPKCKNKKVKSIRETLSIDIDIEANLIVGLHPDGATEPIVSYATKYKIPFVIVPCCIIPTQTRFAGNESQWISHIKSYAQQFEFEVEEYTLSIKGKNRVLIGVPRE